MKDKTFEQLEENTLKKYKKKDKSKKPKMRVSGKRIFQFKRLLQKKSSK